VATGRTDRAGYQFLFNFPPHAAGVIDKDLLWFAILVQADNAIGSCPRQVLPFTHSDDNVMGRGARWHHLKADLTAKPSLEPEFMPPRSKQGDFEEYSSGSRPPPAITNFS
jgi:hypothetical protein